MQIISISIQENLYERLKHAVPSKKISHFVSNVIAHELENMEQELAIAYQEAQQDKPRNQLLAEWDAIEDLDA